MKSVIVFCILCFISIWPCPAQFNFQFDNLELKGLTNGNTVGIIQDSTGFMWVGTGQGLFRYDGYKLKLFLMDSQGESRLTRNSINCLYHDHSGKIWVGTVEGIFQLDPKTETFKSFLGLIEAQKISVVVRAIHEDCKHNIWFLTETLHDRTGGLYRFDQIANKFEKFNFDDLFNYPTAIALDERGNFWIACNQGIVIFDPVLKKIIKHFPNSALANIKQLSSLYVEAPGIIWATSYDGGILRMAFDKDYDLTIRNYRTKDGLVSSNVMSMIKDRKGNFWIVTMGGIMVFNPVHDTWVHLRPSDTRSDALKEFFSKVVVEDRSGNIWIGHSSLGISKVKFNKGFTSISTDDGSSILKGDNISSVYADPQDNLWVAVTGKGVHKLNFRSNFNKPPEVTFYPMPYSMTWTMEKYDDNHLLVAADGCGLCLLNEETGQIRNMAAANATLVRKLPDGILFVSDGRVLNRATGYNLRYTFQELLPDSSTKKRFIRPEYSSLTQENKNQYWLSTWQGDIYFYNGVSNSFSLPRVEPFEPLRISEILVDRNKFLWVAAFEGIFKYRIIRSGRDLTLKLEKKYTEKDGLATKEGASNLFTPAMIEDDHGNIWFAQFGVASLNPETGKIRKYYDEDGLPGNTMSLHVKTKMKNGQLVFGTNKGLFLFHPDSLRDNVTPPPMAITEFNVLNKAEPLSVNRELKYFENVLTFEFTALDFTNPAKNEYAYQMVGFDPDWVYSGNKRTATYTNLDPGTYTFRVKGSNNDGVWNEEGAAIKITILPPPWKTWWANTLYGIAFVLLLFIARNEIVKRERLKTKARLKEVEAEKYQELDVLKSRFFANVSHEFRTPLTLLLGPIEKRIAGATDVAEKMELTVMHRNASRLLTLVNQLLDLSRLDAGTLKLKAMEQSLNEFVIPIASQFSSMADSRVITFKVETKKTVSLFFDPDKLEKVVTNLLSNAFKFTPKGGSISLAIDQFEPTQDFKNGYAEIIISDTGTGIGAEHLPLIFDRFYQVDMSSTRGYEGSGIGLSLTKDLVELHRGKISVTSVVGQGSVFTVQLPLGSSHLKPEEIESSEIEPIIVKANGTDTTYLPEENKEGENINTLPRILIVEDNEDLRYYLRENLKHKFAILEGSDGAQGISMALHEIPDLIISDLMMPKANGLQLCQQLKEDEKTSHIPIVLLTAKADIETKLDGYRQGADDYIPKPFHMDELLVRLENLIANRRRLQQKNVQQLVLGPAAVSVSSMDERFLKKAMEVVEEFIGDSTFGVEPFAQEMGVSQTQLYRKLQGITGLSANEFIRHMRLQRASDLLLQKVGNVADVAYQVGFNNLSYFSKVFKEKFGVTPIEFLKKPSSTK